MATRHSQVYGVNKEGKDSIADICIHLYTTGMYKVVHMKLSQYI